MRVNTLGEKRQLNKCHNGVVKPLFLCEDVIMKNLHIQHPEDSILSGDLSVLDWFRAEFVVVVVFFGVPDWIRHYVLRHFQLTGSLNFVRA